MTSVALVPAGYLAKRTDRLREWNAPATVSEVYSLSGCVNSDFADYVHHWKHNGYWLFNSPALIREIAKHEGVSLHGTRLFYYEVFPHQFDGAAWVEFSPEPTFVTSVIVPSMKKLEGFDVVTFWAGTSPECSPLSCNGMAKQIATNSKCLFDTFDEAKTALERGLFEHAEPGPYRVFSVSSVSWESFS